MLNLQELSLEMTKKNVVKSTKKESVNESLVRILFKDKKKLSRVELISQISLDRLIDEHTEEVLTKLVEKDRKKFDELMSSTNKTVKNGVDTSVSDSKNNSSFSYNEKYKDMKLECISGKYQITSK